MAEESLAAGRAWKLCDSLLRDAAPKVGGVVDDLPTQLPQSTMSDAGMHLNPAVDLSFAPSTMTRFDALQGQLNLPLYTSFDQYMPHDPINEDYYPIAAEMDFLTDEFHHDGPTL